MLGGIAFSRPQADPITAKPAGPSVHATEDAPDTPYMPAKPRQQAKPEESEPTTNLYILLPLTPQLDPSLILTPSDGPALPLQILDTIVAILEGNQSNILLNINKEIVPLLAELQHTLQQAEQPLPPEFAEMLEEVMARTPPTEDIREAPPALAALNNFITTLRAYLCPPGNVNEHQNSAAPPAEFNPYAGTEALIRPLEQRSAPADAEFSRGQPQAEQSANALPEGASFSIAPARLAFAEHFSAPNTQAPQPLSAENLLSAMVERIVSLPAAEPHLEISLKPDHLGKISIDLQLGANGLNAKILASDEGVRNLLAAHLQRLSDTLAERGIRLENLEVAYSALNDKAFDRRQPQEQEARQKSANTLIKLAEPLSAVGDHIYDLPLYGEELDWGSSSLEYLA
jgi:hypothetical protein